MSVFVFAVKIFFSKNITVLMHCIDIKYKIVLKNHNDVFSS
jgi:hypothetical protein